MSGSLVGRWLAAGELDLPLPGAGETAQRWRRLAELTEADVVAGRLAEAHTDAVAILAELGGPDPKPDQLWGVWAAESGDAALLAHGDGDAVSARRHQGVVFGRRHLHTCLGDRTSRQRTSRPVRRRPR